MGNSCLIGCSDTVESVVQDNNNCITTGLNGMTIAATGADKINQTNRRCIRPFTISRITSVQLASDARLYRDQTLRKTPDGLDIEQKHISLNSLKSFIQNELSTDLVIRTKIDHYNIETNKVIQNCYITSFGGLSSKTLKTNHINLLLNATIDLPMVDFPKINEDSQSHKQQLLNTETLRVPISTKEPRTLKLYINDVADKIHENYLKNGNTLIYCYDGSLNSVVLALGYLIKYTDLWLSEAILHMKYTRKGFETATATTTTMNGNELGTFRKPLFRFADKHGKNDLFDSTIKSTKSN